MQHIIQHLFRVDTLEEVPRERLEELVSTYPSFSIGRYLLSRKLCNEQAGDFSEETQKTNLYFPNPFWLQWLLQGAEASGGQAFPVRVAEAPVRDGEEGSGVEPAAEEVFFHEQLTQASEETAPSTGDEADPSTEDKLVPPASEEVDTLTGDETTPLTSEGETLSTGDEATPLTSEGEGVFMGSAAEATAGEQDSGPVIVEEPGVREELEGASAHSSAADALLQHLEEARELRQTLVKMNEGSVGEVEKPVEASPEERAEPTVAAGAGQTGEIAGTAAPIVAFEPYHTIDYFASVGIKLVQEENPSDKLGKQLKSFTEWLKVMRKLPQKNEEIVPDIATEHQIQAIAAHSIKGKEVVTETMAEVLVKQGMREKAAEVYHKLLLLNPDKSAYFATKIEQLKID